jgi:hypothetical protein
MRFRRSLGGILSCSECSASRIAPAFNGRSRLDIASKHGKGERMAFVHEINDYQGEARRAFNFVHDNLNPRKIPMTLAFGAKADYPPLQAADVLAYEGAEFIRNPTETPRRAWVALDPDKTRLIVRRYGPDNMGTLIRTLNDYRRRLLAQGWDGKLTVRV